VEVRQQLTGTLLSYVTWLWPLPPFLHCSRLGWGLFGWHFWAARGPSNEGAALEKGSEDEQATLH